LLCFLKTDSSHRFGIIIMEWMAGGNLFEFADRLVRRLHPTPALVEPLVVSIMRALWGE